MDPFAPSRHPFTALLVFVSLLFCTGCPWGGEGAKVKAAKEAFAKYQEEVAKITSDPQNAAAHHDRAFSFVIQAQQHAQQAVNGRENGHKDLNITAINAAVEQARQGRFTFFTRLAEQYLNSGDGHIVRDPANPDQPANPRAARESYETARTHATKVGNQNLLRSILERLNLRPLRASTVSDQVDELARAQQQAILLASKISGGSEDPHGYGRDWSDTIPEWSETSLEGQLRLIEARIRHLSQEVRTGIGQLAAGNARQELESQMQTLTSSYETGLAAARTQPSGTFWATWERSRPAFESSRDHLSESVRSYSTTRIASPNRVEQPITSTAGRTAAAGAVGSPAQPIIDGDDVRVTGP